MLTAAFPEMCLCGIAQKLRRQVTSLKASRDKLLLQVDKQLLEIDHLSSDHAAMQQVYTQMHALLQDVWHHQSVTDLVCNMCLCTAFCQSA